MQISIIAAGDKMPIWVKECCDDYYRRLPKPFSVKQIEISLEKRSSSQSTAKTRFRETQRLLNAVPENDWLVVLDEKGKHFTTQAFAEKMSAWQEQQRNISFVIGGPDGIDFSCKIDGRKQWPDQRWSLSSLTFPHPLVRVLLAEQVYRGWSVIAGHPYHRD